MAIGVTINAPIAVSEYTVGGDVSSSTISVVAPLNIGIVGPQGIQGPVGQETLQSTGDLIATATAKTTPVDADMVGLMDSATGNILAKLSWLNIKATLKTYLDTLYVWAAGKAGGQTITGGTAAGENLTLSSTSNATKGNIYLGTGFVDSASKLTVPRLLLGNGPQQSGSAALEIVESGAAAVSFGIYGKSTGNVQYTMGTINGGGDVQTVYTIAGVLGMYVGLDQTDRVFKIAGTTLGAGRDFFTVGGEGGIASDLAWRDRVGITIKANALQTVNLFECKNSAGTPLTVIDAVGSVGIGTTTPTSKLQVVGLPTYANNAAAITGGLTAGAFYQTGADPSVVCVTY